MDLISKEEFEDLYEKYDSGEIDVDEWVEKLNELVESKLELSQPELLTLMTQRELKKLKGETYK